MADQSVVKHYLRLNLQNEQHQRIQKVLATLDKGIHKSENQFIIKAIDFYIKSFEDDGIMDRIQQKKKTEYVTVDELAELRKEIESEVKDEIIRLLGSAMIGGSIVRVQDSNVQTENVQKEETEERNPVVSELAARWG